MISPVAMTALNGMTIKEISHYHGDEMPAKSYNHYKIVTTCGRVFVVWNTLGETCLTELKH
jgi:hypothetical protein